MSITSLMPIIGPFMVLTPANYAKPWLLFLVLVIGSSAASVDLHAQSVPYRITLVDKGPRDFAPGSDLYARTLDEYHPDALERRRVHGFSPLLGHEDQPLDNVYLADLAALGIEPLAKMRWRNCFVVELDTLTASLVSQLPYVDRIEPTKIAAYVPLSGTDACWPVRHGSSLTMHDLLNTVVMHRVGVTGQGAGFAVIDNGFELDGMSTLQHIDIRATYDAIYNDDDVSGGPDEPESQAGHGSLVLSIAAGWQHDDLIGIAPFATYLLAKSEDMRYEKRIEEDLYSAAIEWAERNGADVVSSSIGYYHFNEGEDTTQYAWMDGSTTFGAQAINRAVKRGVICVTAAGNNGPGDSTIIIPAEADSVIAVGGSRDNRTAWLLSSVGPTADGRTKPDLGALGFHVLCQARSGRFIEPSGTSMASPQIGGLATLMRQLYKDVHTWSVREAIYSSCVPEPFGTDRLGRGIPDALVAARELGDSFGPGIAPPSIVDVEGQRVILAALFSNAEPNITLQIREHMDSPIQGTRVDSLWFIMKIPEVLFTADTIYGRMISEVNGTSRYFPTDSTWFAISRAHGQIPCGVHLPKTVVSISETPVLPIVQIQPRVVPTPTEFGRRYVELTGLSDITHTILVVNTSSGVGTEIQVQGTSDGRYLLPLPALSPGHYHVVVSNRSERWAIPLIIH